MRHYAILRLLLAGFFLYIAWPVMPDAVIQEAVLFWGVWLGFLLLVVGANFATLLQMTDPPVMEQEGAETRERA
ncbi:hypothetical protein [Lentibacillus amyloliquefaciens]|uniref:Uncharacterized protein n=1 Tax=Lentibacillus amyloliquefaciens TaxID=1472767 RepID=A0A0U4FKW0_9BACI|nr:hypothetical protein [Lentibacillus amyloliquefaciens]ALX48356.1 hypothetical protein AOX59_06875 [Lentibacillus amyloliquefaciens]